jgi:hypothetical protein
VCLWEEEGERERFQIQWHAFVLCWYWPTLTAVTDTCLK